jgi:hypothetical protein
MTKVETICRYFKKQIVVERNHFGVGEHGHSLQDTEGRALLCAEDRWPPGEEHFHASLAESVKLPAAGRPQSRTGFGFFGGRRNGRNVAVLDQGVESGQVLALNVPEGGQGVLGLDALSNDNPVLH